MKELTQERLKELLHYDQDTGFFTRVKTISGRAIKGEVIGLCTHRDDGYIRLKVDCKNYLAHRLAFLFMEGVFPPRHVDHIDHVRHNNKWKNIRHASKEENQRNESISSNNTSGFTGVCWNKLILKWAVCIHVDGRNRHQGYFTTHYAACYARHYANIKYGFHRNHGC